MGQKTGNRSIQSNVDFQHEDKMKKLNLQQARTEIKRANVENMSHKIYSAEVKKETQYSGKLQQKAALSDLYERLCHIQSL